MNIQKCGDDWVNMESDNIVTGGGESVKYKYSQNNKR